MKRFIVVVICCLFLLTSCGDNISFTGGEGNELDENNNINDSIIIDVKGEVNIPGIYTFNKEIRLYEVIKLAGGFTKNAATDGLNLVSMITEDQMIYVPSKAINSNSSNNNINNKVSINNATLKELCTLPGVGESKAKKIIEYRENKRFITIEDLKNVSGIGEELFKKIKPYICL